MALQLPRHKFTADEYEQLGRTGIFTEDDRVELLDGDIVEMSPLGSRHVRCVNRLTMLLAPRLVGKAIVQVQSSLKLDVHWEPQPDVAVLRLRADGAPDWRLHCTAGVAGTHIRCGVHPGLKTTSAQGASRL